MMLTGKWLWPTGCCRGKLHPQFMNWREIQMLKASGGDGEDTKDAQVLERGCENHNLLFRICQEAKSQALIHSPGVHLGLKSGMFPPLHASLPRCQLYHPPPPNHHWGQWIQEGPLPGLWFLFLHRTQGAVRPYMDDLSKHKEHETYSNTLRNGGGGCFSVVMKGLDSQKQGKNEKFQLKFNLHQMTFSRILWALSIYSNLSEHLYFILSSNILF